MNSYVIGRSKGEPVGPDCDSSVVDDGRDRHWTHYRPKPSAMSTVNVTAVIVKSSGGP